PAENAGGTSSSTGLAAGLRNRSGRAHQGSGILAGRPAGRGPRFRLEIGTAGTGSPICGCHQSLHCTDGSTDRVRDLHLTNANFLFASQSITPTKESGSQHKTISAPHMKVTEKDVLYVAALANLALSEEERDRMVKDLNSILDYVERLNQLDTTNVPPMAQISDRFGVDGSKQGTERFK